MKKLLKSLLLTLAVITPFFNTSCVNEVSKAKIDEYTAAYLKINRENLLLRGEATWYCEFKDVLYSKDGVELLVFFDASYYLYEPIVDTCIDDVCLPDFDLLFKPVVYDNGKMDHLKNLIDFSNPSESVYGEERSKEFLKLASDYINGRELNEKEKYYYLLNDRLDNEKVEELTLKFQEFYQDDNMEVSWFILPNIGEYQTYFASYGDENYNYGNFVYKEYANREIVTQEKTDFYLVKDDEIVLLKDAYQSNKITEEDVNKVLDAYNNYQGYYAYWDSLIHFVK